MSKLPVVTKGYRLACEQAPGYFTKDGLPAVFVDDADPDIPGMLPLPAAGTKIMAVKLVPSGGVMFIRSVVGEEKADGQK